jgi:hypothetical protein
LGDSVLDRQVLDRHRAVLDGKTLVETTAIERVMAAVDDERNPGRDRDRGQIGGFGDIAENRNRIRRGALAVRQRVLIGGENCAGEQGEAGRHACGIGEGDGRGIGVDDAGRRIAGARPNARYIREREIGRQDRVAIGRRDKGHRVELARYALRRAGQRIDARRIGRPGAGQRAADAAQRDRQGFRRAGVVGVADRHAREWQNACPEAVSLRRHGSADGRSGGVIDDGGGRIAGACARA